jgi:hypothetical protein
MFQIMKQAVPCQAKYVQGHNRLKMLVWRGNGRISDYSAMSPNDTTVFTALCFSFLR